MDAQTWDSQPYWAQRIYLEGLFIEEPWKIQLTPDPETWWSPLDSVWDSFGELDLTPHTTIQSEEDVTFDDDQPIKDYQSLPKIEDLGGQYSQVLPPQ